MKILGYILTLPIRIFLTIVWFCFTNTLGIIWLVSVICADDGTGTVDVLSGYVNGYTVIWRYR